MRLALVLLLVAAPLESQVRVSPWVTELTAGAVSDVAARGPWMAPSWKRSLWGRLAWSTGLNLAYEYAVEPWNGQANAGRWEDAAQRLVGTLAMEGLCAFLRRF